VRISFPVLFSMEFLIKTSLLIFKTPLLVFGFGVNKTEIELRTLFLCKDC
jgi:hypothetical protein